jgi:nucleotide-binding universal stress UspA family protein
MDRTQGIPTQQDGAHAWKDGGMKKILVAYDGQEAGHRALDMAARLAQAFDGRVDVVSVVPEGFGRIEGQVEEPAVEHARELVEARGILRQRGLEAGLIEPAGDPAQTIERLASERGYDTIVVGGNRPGREGHSWMDSVTAHVAANARADVVVARRALASPKETTG